VIALHTVPHRVCAIARLTILKEYWHYAAAQMALALVDGREILNKQEHRV